VELLNAAELRISMSRSGNPYDNAFAESFDMRPWDWNDEAEKLGDGFAGKPELG
jgi:transposase InsO family protein